MSRSTRTKPLRNIYLDLISCIHQLILSSHPPSFFFFLFVCLFFLFCLFLCLFCFCFFVFVYSRTLSLSLCSRWYLRRWYWDSQSIIENSPSMTLPETFTIFWKTRLPSPRQSFILAVENRPTVWKTEGRVFACDDDCHHQAGSAMFHSLTQVCRDVLTGNRECIG